MRKGSLAYKLLFNLHLYAALTTGVLMIVLSLTGCLLIFERKIDGWFDPQVARVTPQGEPLAYTKLLQQLKSTFPERRAERLDRDAPDAPVVATMRDKSRIYINGYTGEILGARTGQQLSAAIRKIHIALWGGAVGSWVVALTTFLLLFQSLSGIYLWWPLKRLTVNRKGSWLRLNFDLHHAVGFYSCVFVCLLCLTGLVRYYGAYLEPLAGRLMNAAPPPREMHSRNIPAQTDAAAKINIDAAVTIAKAQLHGGTLARIILPEKKNDAFVVSMRFPGDEQPSGRSYVVIDQYNGEVLSLLDMRTAPVGAQFGAINRSIHTGDYSGWPTRLLVALSALAVVLQTLSGFMMWYKRKRFSLWWERQKKLAEERLEAIARRRPRFLRLG